jgi:hypothetical protein
MLTYNKKTGTWSGYLSTSLPTNAKTDYPTSFTVETSDEVVEEKTKYTKGGGKKVKKIKRTYTTKGSDGKVYAVDEATDWDDKGIYGNLYKQGQFVNKKASQDMPYEYKKKNKTNELNNAGNAKKNEENKKKNAVLDKVVQVANTTKGGDYLTQKAALEKYAQDAINVGLDPNDLLDSYDNFYKETKINKWDTAKGAQPPNAKEKGFDAAYYLETYPDVQTKWDEAKAAGDLDVLETYTNPQSFALWDYTVVGKAAGNRGNAAEILNIVKDYVEKAPTDQEKQAIKDDMLGISYQQLKGYAPAKSDVDKVLEEGFEALEEGDVAKADTLLESIVGEEFGQDVIKKTNQFGALAQDTLKETIAEMQDAKKKELMLDVIGNFSGFNEVLNFNKTLAEGLIGDTGIGGVLGITGDKKTLNKIEEGLKGITGANNSTIYNWQQWFDGELSKKYAQDLELGLTEGEAEKQIEIDADFATQYIQQYLKPKFDESKSMSQFIEYIDVFDPEGKFQNPLQTQDMLNAAVDAADLQNKVYLQQLDALKDGTFDPTFYFNPSDNIQSQEAKDLAESKTLQDLYTKQAETVASDWEEAKKQVQQKDGYWYDQAYKYGVDVNNKDEFAKLHYQTVGNQQNFDPAENFATNAKIQDYIYMKVLPAIKDKTATMSVFGNFLKPKDISDQLFAAGGVDPDDKSTWTKMLDLFKIKDFDGSFADLETYVIETLSGNSALEIQKKIKDLKKEGITPTQDNLGVYYIPKAEDKADEAEPKTSLYATFKGAGFKGSEDEFYEEFFPDLSKEEQQLLSKDGLQGFLDLDLSDPYQALGGVEALLAGDEDEDKTSSIFFSFEDDDEEAPTTDEEEDDDCSNV